MSDRRLLSLVRAVLDGTGVLAAAEPVLAGVSGGADSLALLHLLTRLLPRARLIVAHLDHGLRGREGEADAGFVEQVCADLGVRCVRERRDVHRYRKAAGLSSLEEAAREVRYRFFAETAAASGAGCVLVGHTAGDQVETVLLHLIRGAGPAGLAGMRADTTWRAAGGSPAVRVIRPLLGVRRLDTEGYCRRHGLEFRIDATNRCLQPARNRVRHEVLPAMRAVNPRVDEALLRLAHLAGQEDRYWERRTREAWSSVAQQEGGEVRLDRRALRDEDLSLAGRVLRHAYQLLAGAGRDLTSRHVEALERMLQGPSGRRAQLPGGMEAVADYRHLSLRRAGPEVVQPPAPVPLAVPGRTEWGPWVVHAEVREGAVLPAAPGALVGHLDFDSVATGPAIRGRRPGDRFQPLGMRIEKKLQDYLVDARVPRRHRDLLPLLEARGEIAWVGALQVGEGFKVTPGTRSTLVIELIPGGQSAVSLLQHLRERSYNSGMLEGQRGAAAQHPAPGAQPPV